MGLFKNPKKNISLQFVSKKLNFQKIYSTKKIRPFTIKKCPLFSKKRRIKINKKNLKIKATIKATKVNKNTIMMIKILIIKIIKTINNNSK